MNEIACLDVKPTSLNDIKLLDKIVERISDNINKGVLQVSDLDFQQSIHDGVYTRTVIVPPNVILVGALIKIPTTLLVNGDCYINVNSDDLSDLSLQRYTGFNTFKASALRKQIFYTVSETSITMIFATKAKTFDEAEREFTDEYELLMR